MFMRTRGKGTELPRFLLFLVTSSVGWIIIGVILFSSGLVWGLNSHQVSYVHLQDAQGSYQRFLSDDQAYIIIQQNDTGEYYVMHSPDYSPEVDTNTLLSFTQTSSGFSFIASTDFVKIDGQVEGTGQYIGQAHPIEQITFSNVASQRSLTYTSAEYSGNPNGYTINYWPYAAPLALAGVVCMSTSILFLVRAQRRRKLAVAANLAALEARPSPFARELAEENSQAQRQSYRV